MASIDKRGPLQFRARITKKGFPSQTKTLSSREAAEKWVRKTLAAMEQGTFICSKEAEQTILEEALERYAREISPEKKGHAQELQRIKIWKNHPLALRSLASLRGSDLAKYRDERLFAGKASNTIRLELAIISHLFTIARKEWGMESLVNPVQLIRMPKPSIERDRRLQGDEADRLRNAASKSKSCEIGPMIDIALETAARRGEIAAMRWEYINLARKTWHIPETKNGTPRTVPLSMKAIEVLQRLTRIIDGNVWRFCREQGITQAFERVCVRAQIENLHFHDLRHEATSRFFEKGLNIMEVSAITGHKDLKMLKRYTHLRAEDLAVKLG
ncbi:MAG: site-specific integrase [Deltaproteobacteria bacterium]|jgi:integrase|uniref:site-specific integrase n=1 Tax=Hydrosulfovibrio ferrireducens TaxID=2934181 RepID=UPI001219FC4B|nr:MAG: site-specific integrase [Deltaproteobacteria bacterium]